jgi:PKHD-type hydroxylase
MVKSDEKRALLWDLDNAIQALTTRIGQTDPAVVSLTGTYHNLVRLWAEV